MLALSGRTVEARIGDVNLLMLGKTDASTSASRPRMIPGWTSGCNGFAAPGRVAELAHSAEDWGFTGLLVADSQNLTADIWVELALAAVATERLRLGPGVTNPVTRHLTVTASAAATLQAESDGRATLGLARGDSALSQIGRERLSVAAFERKLAMLQRGFSVARRWSSPTARAARSAGSRTAPYRKCRCTWPRPDRGRSRPPHVMPRVST